MFCQLITDTVNKQKLWLETSKRVLIFSSFCELKQITENSSDTVLGKMMLTFIHNFFVLTNDFLNIILHINFLKISKISKFLSKIRQMNRKKFSILTTFR